MTTRAITVQAPAEAVFPWLVQLGQNRGGFYTYDALENLFGLDIHSADSIHPEWQELSPGVDYVALDPQHQLKLTIVELEAPHAMVIRTARRARRRRSPAASSRARWRPPGRSIVEPLDEAAEPPDHPLAGRVARRLPRPPGGSRSSWSRPTSSWSVAP